MKKTIIAINLILGGLMFADPSLAMTISPPRFEISVNPGQQTEAVVKLINETDKEAVLYSSASNFSAEENEEGVPKFYDLKEGEEGLAKWIGIEKGPFIIKPFETKEINFVVNVPNNADPGGHYAAIFFGSQPSDSEGGAVGLTEKIGALILLRVSGDIREDGRLVEFKLDDSRPFYNHLPVNFFLLFENTGNVHLKPKGDIVITNMLGKNSSTVTINKDTISGGKNVLPQTSRHFETTWTGGPMKNTATGFLGSLDSEIKNFAFGRYTGKLNLEYGSSGKKSEAAVVFWVFPWHLLLVVFLGIVIVVSLLIIGIINYNKWVVKKALEQMNAKK